MLKIKVYKYIPLKYKTLKTDSRASLFGYISVKIYSISFDYNRHTFSTKSAILNKKEMIV